jgi:hypothetical protein
VAINTDDLTRVEFGFARSVTGSGNVRADDIEALARIHGDDPPAVVGGNLDDTLIGDERVSFAASLGIAPRLATSDEGQRARSFAISEWLASRYALIPDLWRRQTLAPRTLVDRMVLGDGLAELGDTEALTVASALKPLWPSVAAGIEARLLFRTGKTSEAIRAFERSLVAYQSDPWPPPTFMLRTLSLAVDLASANAVEAQRLFVTLAQPFAAHMMDEARANARVELSKHIPAAAACVEALSYFEPDHTWNAEALSNRVRCYETTRPDMAVRARDDLAWFRSHSPARFSAAMLR